MGYYESILRKGRINYINEDKISEENRELREMLKTVRNKLTLIKNKNTIVKGIIEDLEKIK